MTVIFSPMNVLCARCIKSGRLLRKAHYLNSRQFQEIQRTISFDIPYEIRQFSSDSETKSGSNEREKPFKIEVDTTELDKILKEEQLLREGKIDPQSESHSGFRAWVNAKTVTLVLGTVGIGVAYVIYDQTTKTSSIVSQSSTVGKTLIGGEWELLNTEGKLQSSKDFLGKWVLMYFGFANCPDICPEQLEKMVAVINMMQDRSKFKKDIPIVPILISIDPQRDTPARLKKYVEEFSPTGQIKAFTGTPEQIAPVLKQYRIYSGQGPKTSKNDYILDHTVWIYLFNPEGEFVDNFGQKRKPEAMAEAIQQHAENYESEKRGKNSRSWWPF
ncbi:SCO1/SenC domain-containing protein [Ditylenchus destructor]|uniref:SCO1/SenC domain-containing protein n=1 Tax=Ditylenchus destructor TaxID=166010 RepID=A0AAD4MVL4_9BILA|nr:SCO1/SenC domain-containing protein [Ditylenchus destructor]